jgi:hypothetical protein
VEGRGKGYIGKQIVTVRNRSSISLGALEASVDMCLGITHFQKSGSFHEFLHYHKLWSAPGGGAS